MYVHEIPLGKLDQCSVDCPVKRDRDLQCCSRAAMNDRIVRHSGSAWGIAGLSDVATNVKSPKLGIAMHRVSLSSNQAQTILGVSQS